MSANLNFHAMARQSWSTSKKICIWTDVCWAYFRLAASVFFKLRQHKEQVQQKERTTTMTMFLVLQLKMLFKLYHGSNSQSRCCLSHCCQRPNRATSNNTPTVELPLKCVGNHLEDFTDRHWTRTLQYWSGVRKLKLSGKTGTRHSRKLSSARKVSHPFTQAYELQLHWTSVIAYQTCSLLTLKI